MKKLIFLCALCCALFSACQKDCEKDKTATVSVTNQSESSAVFFSSNNSRVIDAGQTVTFDLSLPETFDGSNTVQSSFSYKLEGSNEMKETAAWLTVCQTTQITLD